MQFKHITSEYFERIQQSCFKKSDIAYLPSKISKLVMTKKRLSVIKKQESNSLQFSAGAKMQNNNKTFFLELYILCVTYPKIIKLIQLNELIVKIFE